MIPKLYIMSSTKAAADKAGPKVKELPKTDVLVSKIQKYQEMHKMVQNRAKFVETLDELKELEFPNAKDLQNFENPEGVKLVLKTSYSREGISISNQFIVSEFVEWICKRIQSKVDQLDKALIA